MVSITHHSKAVFFPGMFEEALTLLTDAQDYFTHTTPGTQEISALEKLVYSSEMSRVTLRLSSVLAWLMARRAEFAGQISREEAAAQFRLAFHEVCMKEMPEMRYVLPTTMCALLDRSLDLYRRAARLDSMITAETVH